MVEVFKTNVTNTDQAVMVVDRIHRTLPGCVVNFDLEDCDKILRIVCDWPIDQSHIISLLNDIGFKAEVLPDDQPVNPLLEIMLQD